MSTFRLTRGATGGLLGVLMASALVLTGCSGQAAPAASESAPAAATVTIDATNGKIEVPVSPERVVALDNTSFETLRDWGVTPVAVPKRLLPSEGFEAWIDNDEIVDLGNHREPDLEALSAVEADLVIGGYRFGEYTQQITDMNIAPVIDIAASRDAAEGWTESLRTQTIALGQIFDRADDARDLVAALDSSVENASEATSGESVFLGVVTGGKLDNGAQRIGTLIEPLDLTDVFAGEEGDVHGDSGLAPETIAQANPDWLIILDRDAGVSTEGAVAAKQVIDAQEAFASTTFATRDQVIYLDPLFYVREGIQAFTEAFTQISTAFDAS